MLDTAATHFQERMANDRQQLRALLKGMGDVVPPDALRRSAFFFERQQLSWLNGLDGHGIMEAEQLAAAYDDALLRENRRNIFDWVRPTDPAAVHWAPPFRPERTVLPPGSNDERERRALFIASHEFVHHLYQWQPDNGWQLIPVEGAPFFSTLDGQLSSARNIENHLEGIPLKGPYAHAVYSNDSKAFPFRPAVCPQVLPIAFAEGRLWGEGMLLDLRWADLSVTSPQADGGFLCRHFRQWGLRNLFRAAFPAFTKPCRGLLHLLITGQPRIPCFSEEELSASALQAQLAPHLQDVFDFVRESPLPVFLAGWFNCHLLRQMLQRGPCDFLTFGEENVLTPWQYSLRSMEARQQHAV